MKTQKQVISERPTYARLIRAVIRNIGIESVQDVVNHGIDGGFNGFIYTADTVRFFEAHKNQIMQLAEEQARDFGQGVLDMIRGFNCLQTQGKPDYTTSEIAKGIFAGGQGWDMSADARIIQNAMAWYAAEEVCRWFVE